jgi:glycosyltransferase involved in cell wall biosynthesis
MANNKKNKSQNLNLNLNLNANANANANTNTKPTVSIITITQYKRFECIKILLDLIRIQTYPNIIEWVIVEGSKTDLDAESNKKNILELINEKQPNLPFKIVYVSKEKNVKLGELRNIGNKTCKSDITVCMDDDDYYPNNRVEHAVSKLSQSTCKIAGCSAHLMYDYDINMFVQMKQLGPNHSTNSCMAWKKEYLETNTHDSEKEFGEEQSFTKNFTEPMVQLDPFSTVILSSHSFNTFSKKRFFIAHLNQVPNTIDKTITKPIEKYISPDLLLRFRNIFVSNNLKNNENYDIVYMCGAFSINWEPNDKKLGGSEQAVVNLSENWVKLGKSVIVYGEVPSVNINGVVYKNWTEFDFNKKYKNLILWRNFGLSTSIPLNVKADFICVDVHDNFVGQVSDVFKKFHSKCNKIFLKSNYHKDCLLNKIDKNIEQDKIIVIPNGIRVNQFNTQPNDVQRNPYRFCYCSCYTRGLDKIISILWPIIYNYEPRAELHVYYGMNGIRDENYKNYLLKLLAQPGVMDHGRQPIEIIIREKYLSTFHFYITNTEAEIDCISIRESLVSGCIPLLSNFGVFKERQGLHYDFNDEKEIKMAAINIINLLKNPQKVSEFREKIKNDPTIIDWETIALEWMKHFIN